MYNYETSTILVVFICTAQAAAQRNRPERFVVIDLNCLITNLRHRRVAGRCQQQRNYCLLFPVNVIKLCVHYSCHDRAGTKQKPLPTLGTCVLFPKPASACTGSAVNNIYNHDWTNHLHDYLKRAKQRICAALCGV